jgi:hypothetical protein
MFTEGLVRVLIVVIFLALSCFASAQSTKLSTEKTLQNVDLCELIHYPQKYDGRMIRVRGRVRFEFEDFTLDDPACKTTDRQSSEPGVWLTFGGDESELAVFCCGSTRRKAGSDIEIGGHKVALIRDANFRVFLNRIGARRLRRPDGRECYDHCKFYRVTATLTGLFARAKDDGGYGHFGMFHLLVIQQVEQVSTERTSVPFGGVFQCLEEKWQPGADLMPALAKSLKCEGSTENDCGPERRFQTVAAHWNESLDRGFQTEVYTDTAGDLVANWVSSDLQTSYFTRTKGSGDASVARERCTASLPTPEPSSPSIACEEHHRTLDDATDQEVERLLSKDDFTAAWAKEAEGAKHLFAEGDQSWRLGEAKTAGWHALLEQTREWKVSPNPALQFAECADASTEESPTFMGCNWYSPDGTQAFSVTLFKNRIRGTIQRQAQWLVTGVDADVCRASE